MHLVFHTAHAKQKQTNRTFGNICKIDRCKHLCSNRSKAMARQYCIRPYAWWRHQMETFSALLAICAGNSPVPGEFRAQRPVTRSFDVFFALHPNKRLSKQWWGWWFETPPFPLRRHRNGCQNVGGVIVYYGQSAPLILHAWISALYLGTVRVPRDSNTMFSGESCRQWAIWNTEIQKSIYFR